MDKTIIYLPDLDWFKCHGKAPVDISSSVMGTPFSARSSISFSDFLPSFIWVSRIPARPLQFSVGVVKNFYE